MKKIKALSQANLLAAIAMTALAAGFATFGSPAAADDVIVDGKIITAENYDSRSGGGLNSLKLDDTSGGARGAGTARLGSLNGVGSTSNLFLNSRGGDQNAALLLPAVQKVREAAAHQTAGASAPDAPERGALNFANPGATKGLNFTNQADTRGLNFTNPGATQGLNFANQGDTKGLNFANPGAAKGLNFTNTARK